MVPVPLGKVVVTARFHSKRSFSAMSAECSRLWARLWEDNSLLPWPRPGALQVYLAYSSDIGAHSVRQVISQLRGLAAVVGTLVVSKTGCLQACQAE